MKPLNKTNRYKWPVHLLFWGGYLWLSVFVFSGREDFNLAITLSLIQIIPQIFIAYLNMEVLIPRYFIHKKYAQYFGYTLASFVVLYLFYDILPEIYHAILPPPPEEVRHWVQGTSGEKPNYFNRMRRLRLSYALTQTLAIYFLSTAFKTTQLALHRERESADLKSENLNAELKFLRSQINPHFLFNALNNIYSLSILKSDKTPDTILKLSEMLRYIIYDCNAELVPLSKELSYINNYIGLQQLKEEEMTNVTMDFSAADGNCMIAPMILIPFIENSFKHSNIEDQKNSWISMKLATRGDELHFQISNTVSAKTNVKDASGGIGLENVKRRLELIYAGRHVLHIAQKEDEFSVELTIFLAKNT